MEICLRAYQNVGTNSLKTLIKFITCQSELGHDILERKIFMKQQKEIILDQIPVGPMANFQYFIGDQQTKKVALVDPGWDIDEMLTIADKKNYIIVAVVCTHAHYDHIKELEYLLGLRDVPVSISKYESGVSCKNLKKCEDGDKIKIGNIELTCIHTPGHSAGDMCFLCGDILLTGDTLFIDGCGRCDLAGGNPKKMYDSLFNKIAKLPDATIIYPGHDYGPTPSATLASQKQTNPYLQSESLEDFLHYRMGI